MDKGLLQREVARFMNVNDECIYNWENNRFYPNVMHFPKIIEFLGYDPVNDHPRTLIEKMQSYRRKHGLSVYKFAARMGVTEHVVFAIEKQDSSRLILPETIKNIEEFLGKAKALVT